MDPGNAAGKGEIRYRVGNAKASHVSAESMASENPANDQNLGACIRQGSSAHLAGSLSIASCDRSSEDDKGVLIPALTLALDSRDEQGGVKART